MGLPGLVALGIALRGWLLASPYGHLNSDEAHTSIQARELFRGHAWVLVPGTPYGGNAEAWLDAPLAAMFGLSALRNKVEVAALWLVAALILARAVRHLGRGPAAAAFAAVWLPGAALVVLSTLAYPGYSAGLVATCGLLLLARPLLDEPAPQPDATGAVDPPPGLWPAAAIGALAGFAVWQHPLYGWVCATTVAAVMWRQRRRVVRVLAPLLAGGVGALTPVLVTNLRNDLVTLRFRTPATAPYPDRVWAWVTDLYPRAIGAKWQGLTWVTGRVGQVMAVLVLALLLATCLAVLRWSPPSGKVAAGSLLLAPLAMPALGGNTGYTLDGRYAAMALPVAGVVVAHGVALLPRGWVTGLRVPVAVAAWALLAVVVPFRSGFGPLGAPEGEVDQLVSFLDSRGVTAVRADYWVAYRIVVRTDERIAASPIAPVKFKRYEQLVRADQPAGRPRVLVLTTLQAPDFLAGTPPFDSQDLDRFRAHERVEVAQWAVFLPAGMNAMAAAEAG